MIRRTGMLLAALLLTGCAGGDGPAGGDPAAPPEQPTALPPSVEAPAGTRLVGQGRVVLAVPEGWRTLVYDACSPPRTRTVYFVTGRRQACDRALRPRGAIVVVQRIAPDDEILLVMDRGPAVGGAPTLRTSRSCRSAPPLRCDQSFALPEEGLLFQVHTSGAGARAALAAAGRSFQLLPDGWTTVPPIAYGTSDGDALADLEEAGLDGEVPDVDWPHYVTATVPPVGTVVEEGSVVDLEIGDG